jgi:mannose-6-phosphate isomerase-like protein (cupin superfamily)
MSNYSIATRTDATDWMEGYSGFGEMLSYTEALEAEQVALTWRTMPPDTGGRGSYGHRHLNQEELYLVTSGAVTFKVGDDVFEAAAGTAVRVAGAAFRSVHNDGAEDATLVICSVRLEPAEQGSEKTGEDFWPREGGA